VSLVPAYRVCATPNRTHGPPLAFDSCTPPVQTSDQLTVGTPDANAQAPVSIGTVRLATLTGDPGTPADEADVQVSLSLSDVREQPGLGDYGGDVTVALSARLTDRDGYATTMDFPFEVPATCAVTAGPQGSLCSTLTTLDALLPGAVDEGARAIWEVGVVEVLDGAGNVFARQGVFVP
jgi:hypothetical protein